MKGITTLLLFLLCICSIQGQDIEVPDIDSLEKSLTEFHNLELQAQLKAFERTKSSAWKDLLPSVGVAYTPSGAPRPAASWSPLQIIDRKEKDKKRKLDRESLKMSYELLLTERLYKLRQLYHDYEIDRKSLLNQMESTEIDQQIFAITERKYEENLIKPSEYLKAKKAMLDRNTGVIIMEEELLKQKNALLYEAKWSN